VSTSEQDKTARLQAVLNALVHHQLSESLGLLETSLQRWRQGEIEVFDAHKEVLKHVARSERLGRLLAQQEEQGKTVVLRDAWDAGLIEREEFVALTGVEPESVEPSRARGDSVGIPPKPDMIRDYLEEGSVLVHVDARHAEVSVPEHLKDDPKLVLRFGYQLKPAIADLEIDDEGISGTLTFRGTPHHCMLAWPAVYAMVSEADEKGMVWPHDVPEVVLSEMSTDPHGDSGRSEMAPRDSGRSGAAAGAARTSDKGKRRASHLKLVE
jgi:stringent starvation protein B